MKIRVRPVEVELLHTGGRTDGQTNRKKDRHTYIERGRQTDGQHGEYNSRFSQSCKRV